jgi:hypothetical protein
MSDMDFAWIGMEALQEAFVRAGAQVDTAAKANVADATLRLIKDARDNFEGSHAKGQPHVGGSKPNVVTGDLRRSIMAAGMVHHGMASYSNQVAPTMRYGRRVELGLAPTGAYPYFGPAAAKLRSEMGAIAEANWAKHIKF